MDQSQLLRGFIARAKSVLKYFSHCILSYSSSWHGNSAIDKKMQIKNSAKYFEKKMVPIVGFNSEKYRIKGVNEAQATH